MKGKSATQITNYISAVYNKGFVDEMTVWRWFARFKAGYIKFSEQDHYVRLSTTGEYHINTQIEKNLKSEKKNIIPLSRFKVWNIYLNRRYLNRVLVAVEQILKW